MQLKSKVRSGGTFHLRVFLSLITGGFILLGSLLLSQLPINFVRFATLGYISVFLVTLLSTTLFFPVPLKTVVFAAGMFFNPIGVAIAAGSGSTIGELLSYCTGSSTMALGRASKWYPTIMCWMRRHYGVTIFILSLIPNPIFNLAGIMAGMMRYSVVKFALACLTGKTLQSLVLASLGSYMG